MVDGVWLVGPAFALRASARQAGFVLLRESANELETGRGDKTAEGGIWPWAPTRPPCQARRWLTALDDVRNWPSVRRELGRGYASSLKGLKTFSPGRRKSRSLPVTIVRLWRRAVAAM